ncbi:two-component system regulatory protein YycI [Lactobacillus terrae]|uniref:two-component system regulatory protein YycI n=1 Tax=Lactobacillus terrae TaxID=2269374 RepID=UPI000C1B7425|nr:two-component system regulatory protein YycI [Lactobacillus terrae]
MDFRRIEIIFLVVFVSLDVFLLLSFRSSQHFFNSGSTVTSTSVEMKKRNISTGKLDSDQQYGYYLGAKPSGVLGQNYNKLKNQSVTYIANDDKISSNLISTLNVNGKKKVSVIDNFMKKDSNILFGEKYTYSPQLSSSTKIVYAQNVSSGAIFDKTAQLVFTVSGDKIVSYTQTYIPSASVLHEKSVLKSEKDVVDNLYTNSEIPNNSKITYINLAYTKLLEANDNTIYIPVWFVTIKNTDNDISSTKQVNAFTGAIIKDDSSSIGDN